MKTVKTIVNVKWNNLGNNIYSATLGGFLATVSGKKYYINDLTLLNENHECPVFEAKSRSIKDAMQRATNKLAKLAVA